MKAIGKLSIDRRLMTIIGGLLVVVASALPLLMARTSAQNSSPLGPDYRTMVIADQPMGHMDLSAGEEYTQSLIFAPTTDAPACQTFRVGSVMLALSRHAYSCASNINGLVVAIRTSQNGPNLAIGVIDGNKITSRDPLNPDWISVEFDRPATISGSTQAFLVVTASDHELLDHWQIHDEHQKRAAADEYKLTTTPTNVPSPTSTPQGCGEVLRWSIDDTNPYSRGEFTISDTDALAKLNYTLVTQVKVLALYYDPVIENMQNQRLHQAVTIGWNDPASLASMVAQQLEHESANTVSFQLAESWQEWAPHTDPNDDYQSTTWPCWSGIDGDDGCFEYSASSFSYSRTFATMIDGESITDHVNNGDFDEIWVFADPTANIWTSVMAGPDALSLDGSPPVISGLNRRVTVMGFNYQAPYVYTLRALANRVQQVMRAVYGGSNDPTCTENQRKDTLFHQFTRIDACLSVQDRLNGEIAGIGRVDAPINAQINDPDSIDSSSEFANMVPKPSEADEWLYFPDMASHPSEREIACETDWACAEGVAQETYLLWWLGHIPRYRGMSGTPSRFNNLWPYVFNTDCYPEIQ